MFKNIDWELIAFFAAVFGGYATLTSLLIIYIWF